MNSDALRNIDQSTFESCIKVRNYVLDFLLGPGQYPYIDNPPQSPFRKGGEATQEAPCPTE